MTCEDISLYLWLENVFWPDMVFMDGLQTKGHSEILTWVVEKSHQCPENG